MSRAQGLAVSIAATLALSGCGYSGANQLPLPTGVDLGSNPYTVYIRFDDVQDLARRATVRTNDVPIGTVDSIRRDGWEAIVKIRLAADVVLPSGTRATVEQTGLLGEKFVALHGAYRNAQRPSSAIRAGATIGIESTASGAEVENVLGALSLLLNGGGLSQLKTIAAELHQALGSNDVDARAFLRQLDAFATTMDRSRTKIVSSMENLDRLTATLNRERRVVKTALDDIAPALQEVGDQQDELTEMLRALTKFSDTGTRVIAATRDDLVANLRALQPTLSALARTGDDLPQALETILSYPFPDEALDAAKGDYVNAQIEINLSLTDTLKAFDEAKPDETSAARTDDSQRADRSSNLQQDPRGTDSDNKPASPAQGPIGQLVQKLRSILGGGAS